jgi:MFS-type transporter involved in bile tolerance (Atg22 family)
VPTQSLGVGRLLIAIYAIFALSATARASYQLIREFDQAPLAYSLSAISALVYVLATISLTKQQDKWQRIAKITIWFELIGVIVVGTLSLLLPDLFAHPSVWSGFGVGYAFIPLLLPVLGLIWLRKHNAGNN